MLEIISSSQADIDGTSLFPITLIDLIPSLKVSNLVNFGNLARDSQEKLLIKEEFRSDYALDPILNNETKNIKLFNATFFIWN